MPLAKSSKRIRKPTAKAADPTANTVATSDSEQPQTSKQAPKARRIHWNVARTERLLDWLEENPEDRQKLFSDSSKDAKDEGRRKRVAKSTKSEFHKMIATSVFSVDDDTNIRADFHSNPVNYTKSVDNYITRLVFFSFTSLFYALTLLVQAAEGISLFQREARADRRWFAIRRPRGGE